MPWSSKRAFKMASHQAFVAQQTLIEASNKAPDEWAKLLAYGMAQLTTTMIQEIEAMSERFERLSHKLDRIEKKIGSRP